MDEEQKKIAEENLKRWKIAKRKVASLEGNYSRVIEDKIRTAPKQVRIVEGEKGTQFTYVSTICGFEAWLVWKKFEEGNDVAYYAVFNPYISDVYMRDLTEL